MRSKKHVTEATMLVIDVDGLTALDFRAGLAKITGDGLTSLFYTTHSHGSVEKPGTRARLAIPLDRPLSTEEYAAAWHGFDQYYWGGKAGQADASGANLYQQQGTYCCHPDRVDNARAKNIQQGVASAGALIALGNNALGSKSILSASAGGPVSQIRFKPRSDRRPTSEGYLSENKKMLLRVLLSHIDPDSDYNKWCHAGMALYTETGGSDEGLELFDEWSGTAKQKYAGSAKTTEKWHSFSLDVENPRAIGTLFHFARENGFSPDMIHAEVEWLEYCGGDQDAA